MVETISKLMESPIQLATIQFEEIFYHRADSYTFRLLNRSHFQAIYQINVT